MPVFDEVVTRPSVALLDVLERAATQRNLKPDADLLRLASLLSSTDEAIRGGAARLIGVWGLEELRPRLEKLAETQSSRAASFAALAQLGGEASWKFLAQQVRTQTAAADRLLAAQALAAQDTVRAAPIASAVLEDADTSLDTGGLVASFLARKGGAKVLATALAGRKLRADVGKVALRMLPAGRDDLATLREALQQAAGLRETRRTLSASEIALLEAAIPQGNPTRGEEIYRRNELGCLSCHAIGGAGGAVGPDLMSLGTTAQLDYLVASLVEPNKAVKENYHAQSVVTRDGGVLTGIRIREGPNEVVFRNADDKELSVRREAIIDVQPAGSLMPAGLPDALTHAELRDLVSFLATLGKPGPFSIGKIPTARTWRVLNGRKSTPAYSRVSGLLPLDGLPRARHDIAVVLTTQVLATTAGEVLLTLNGTQGLTVNLDGTLLEVERETKIHLTDGPHVLTFRVDPAERRDGLLCQLASLPGSPAVVRFEGGK